MRRAKVLLIVAGVIALAAFIAWGSMMGFADLWIGVGIAFVAAYALAGWFSYRGERGRLIGVTTAAVLTLAVAIISFFHFGLLAGGLAVTAGCALRPNA